jgi:hypothetical protein
MKRNILSILALTSLLAVGQQPTPTKITPQPIDVLPEASFDVAILYSSQDGTNDGTGYQYQGAKLYCSSTSSNSVTFPQMKLANEGGAQNRAELWPTADAIKYLLDNRYSIVAVDPGQKSFLLVRTNH